MGMMQPSQLSINNSYNDIQLDQIEREVISYERESYRRNKYGTYNYSKKRKTTENEYGGEMTISVQRSMSNESSRSGKL